jgi:hypothetical protein
MSAWQVFGLSLFVPLAVFAMVLLASGRATRARGDRTPRSPAADDVHRTRWCESVRSSLRKSPGFLYPLPLERLAWARWGAEQRYFELEDLGYAFIAKSRRETTGTVDPPLASPGD